MDFDEYEYLEKTVEDAEIRQEKDRSSSRKHRDGEGPAARRSRAEEQNGERSDRDDREKERRKKEHYRQQRSRRDGERERDRDRDLRSRERDRKMEKDREGERDKDREGEREREREREIEREIERARSRERREQELEREIRERESRRFKEKKELTEPEADPERDLRTVFAYQMSLKATERDVYEFFSQVGKVRDVRLIMDRNSRRSKGVGYIEFYNVMTVPQAIALSGQLLLGQPVMVKPSEAEKNLVQSNTTGAGAAGAAAERKLYVGNLHFNITEDQLRQIFEPFGAVELVQLPLDLETGHCRGYGFVQFAQVEHAKAAQSLNGKLDIAGRVLKISAVTDHVGVQESGANSADFADEDGGNLSLNARSRAILMRKLDRTGAAASIAESLGVPVFNGAVPDQQALSLPINGQTLVPVIFPAQGASSIEDHVEPSNCLLLKNMFDPGTETEPDFDFDIKEDVHEECSKFGHVKHIYVDKNSNGCVYLRFDTVAAAAGCQRAMHGRWFAGRSISATFMRLHEYEARLGRAA